MKKFFLAFFSIIFVAGGYVAADNRQAILDWWFLRSYQPPAHIAKLADEAAMSEEGRRLFYVSDPTLDKKEQFNFDCPFKEHTIVLGCYDGRYIYILDVTEKELEGVEEVTAAHEMLHAAYKRLDGAEKERINSLLDAQIAKVKNQRVLGIIAEYEKDENADIQNELHSILPTELSNLSTDLEDYYSRYFKDRSVVVKTAQDYAGVFTKLESRIKAYDEELTSLKSQIDRIEGELTSLRDQIIAGRSELERLKAEGKTEEYNAKVPTFNSTVREYNGKIESLKGTIAEYNRIVKLRNEIALRQNELIQSLDTSFQEL